MTRIFSILIVVLFLSVGHTASAQGLLNRALASLGNADAQTKLGYAYSNGRGVEQDYVEAFKWYRLAAEQGNTPAQNNLGAAYFKGRGAIQDVVYSHMWFNISASLGNMGATEAIDVVAEEMTPEQIAEAQKLARECVRKAYKDC